MRNDIKKKVAPVVCAGIVLLVLGVYLAGLAVPLLSENHGDAVTVAVVVIYALAVLVIMGGVLLALRQRLREIRGGEEEDAGKY